MSKISYLGDETEFVLHTSLMQVPPRRSCFEANESINHDILALAPSQGLIFFLFFLAYLLMHRQLTTELSRGPQKGGGGGLYDFLV